MQTIFALNLRVKVVCVMGLCRVLCWEVQRCSSAAWSQVALQEAKAGASRGINNCSHTRLCSDPQGGELKS